MKLLTNEIRARLPKLHTTQNDQDPIAQAKFIAPWCNWTWYVTEFDGDDIFFGYVCGFDRESGYFNLAELESLRGPCGQRVEHDISFQPAPISKLTSEE